MSRLQRYIHGLASGYAVLIAATVFSLAMVPLALEHLPDKARFGLWSLLVQISTYLALADLGVGQALSRLLIDHKDGGQTTDYAGYIRTGAVAGCLQGLVILVPCLLGGHWIGGLLDLEGAYRVEFARLLAIQGWVLQMQFTFRIFAQLLYAHQRVDLWNYGQLIGLGLNFLTLWLGLEAGWGVLALVAGQGASAAFSAIWCAAWCGGLRVLPGWRDLLGTWSWEPFRRTFLFSQDIFLITLAGQVILGCHAFIVSRQLGLEAVALWGIGVRALTLVNQLVWRVFDQGVPGLAEMFVRGEEGRLRHRFGQLAKLSSTLGSLGAVGLAFGNRHFMEAWTKGEFTWSFRMDLLLGVWCWLTCLVHCHCSLPIVTKRLAGLRRVYLLEAVLLVFLGGLMTARFGMSGLVAAALLCTACLTCAYGLWVSHHSLHVSWRDLIGSWNGPAFLVALLASFAAHWSLEWTQRLEPIWRFGGVALSVGVVGIPVLLWQAARIRAESKHGFAPSGQSADPSAGSGE